MKFFLLGFALFALLSCAGTPVSTSENLVRITILHTNDVHGHAWPFGTGLRGGLAAQAFKVKQIRKEVESGGGVVLLLSAGDVNTGVAESDYFQAKPDFLAMQAMGYDAMVLGNHEFDHGPEQIEIQKKWVKFPLLSANVHYKSSSKGRKLAEPFVIIKKTPLNIGIIGLTTDALSYLTLPKFTNALEIENPVEVAKSLIPQMEKGGEDFIIALTHMGLSETGKRSNTVIVNDDSKLAAEIPIIPLIIGGHSHTLLPNGVKVGTTLLAQAGEWGQNLGRVDLVWDKKVRKMVSAKATVVPIDPKEGEDAEVKKLLDKYRDEALPKFDAVIGIAAEDLGVARGKSRAEENPLGNLICDILRDQTKSDVAIFNSGGIRASIGKGPIHVRDVHQAFPFKNTVSTTTVSGALLKKIILQGIQNRHHTGSLLQVSGMKYSFKENDLAEISVHGQPIDDGHSYSLVTNSFVMAGGDNLTSMVESGDRREMGETIDEAFIRFVKEKKKVNARQEGRILPIR